MKRAVKLLITGSIQSLFFRQFIKNTADEKNIKGFVRNLPDSKVEVFIEGNSEDIDNMIAICKRGQRHSQIRNVEEIEERFQGIKDFKILNI